MLRYCRLFFSRGWLYAVTTVSEQELLDSCGLDAAVGSGLSGVLL